MSESILEKVIKGEPARLIPVTPDRQKESRAISSLLAAFRIIPDYANMMLDEVGAPTNKRAKLTAYTEVCFKVVGKKPSELPRPDGLLVVESRKKEWVALLEVKVKNEEPTAAQIERYLDLAREIGANAVITISNQFALLPTHHPVRVNRQKTRSVDLYHFSWLSLLSNAQLLSEDDKVTDREQAMVLKELIRFLEHENSGVRPFDRMSSEWKDVCEMVQRGTPLRKTDEKVKRAVTDWHELCRYLALQLSGNIAKPVSVRVLRKHAKDPERRLNADIEHLVKNCSLEEEFEIPNAASRINLTADLMRRTATFGMTLGPPKDRKLPTAAINWLTRQVDEEKGKNVLIKCKWPGRTKDTMRSLGGALEDPKSLVPDGVSGLPAALEVLRVHDLAGRFRGNKTVVDDLRDLFPAFYRDVGQDLRAWVASPPKYRRKAAEEEEARATAVESSMESKHERKQESRSRNDDTSDS